MKLCEVTALKDIAFRWSYGDQRRRDEVGLPLEAKDPAASEADKAEQASRKKAQSARLRDSCGSGALPRDEA